MKPPPSTLSDDRLSHKQYSNPTVHVVPEATKHEAAAFYLRPSGPLVLNEATELQDHSVLKPEQRAAAPHLHPLHCIKTPRPPLPPLALPQSHPSRSPLLPDTFCPDVVSGSSWWPVENTKAAHWYS